MTGLAQPAPTRPQRIAVMRAQMQALDRARAGLQDALRASNDIRHQDFFAGLLDRLGLIVANERQGLTGTLAGDLVNVRSALRRLPLPDIDPDIGTPTEALWRLRGARGNLVEAIDNALEAAAALRLHPRDAEFGAIRIDHAEVAEQLIRLDERLRVVEDAVQDLDAAAREADRATDDPGQRGLVNVYVQTLKVEVSAARFETKVGATLPSAGVDLAVLTRSVGAMQEVAADLRQAVEGLAGRMAAPVRAAGRVLIRAAERSGAGLKTVVSWARRRLTRAGRDAAAGSSEAEVLGDPPPDFDINAVRKMILAGRAPPQAWRPWICDFDFRDSALADLAPLAGLTALQRLDLDLTTVADLAPLARLIALQTLSLNHTSVADLAPLADLTALRGLYLNGTSVADLAPLASLTALQTLSLEGTAVADLAPLAAREGLTVYVGTDAHRDALRASLRGRLTSVAVEVAPWLR